MEIYPCFQPELIYPTPPGPSFPFSMLFSLLSFLSNMYWYIQLKRQSSTDKTQDKRGVIFSFLILHLRGIKCL